MRLRARSGVTCMFAALVTVNEGVAARERHGGAGWPAARNKRVGTCARTAPSAPPLSDWPDGC